MDSFVGHLAFTSITAAPDTAPGSTLRVASIRELARDARPDQASPVLALWLRLGLEVYVDSFPSIVSV
jgi:hypothetical protein